MTATQFKEKAGKAVLTAAALLSIAAVLSIFIFLLVKSFPAFEKIGFFDFLFGDRWTPDRHDRYDSESLAGTYGILTMIVGSAAATLGALFVGGILGFFTAVFLAFYCPNRLKRLLSAFVSLLAGIPSVVYGFFGIVFLLPLLSHIAPNNGSGLLATSLILGIMILPTVVSLARTSLEAVPQSEYEGAMALGSTHTEAVFRVLVPSARSGIVASLILGVGRALGETMAVVMVAGNAPAYPDGLFGSFRVMTANIVMEMGYAGEVQEGALVATGVILLLFVLLVNMLVRAIFARACTRRAAAPARSSPVRSFFARFRRRRDKAETDPCEGLDEKKNDLRKDKKRTAGTAADSRHPRSRIRVFIGDLFGRLSYRLRLPLWGKGGALIAGGFTSLTLILIIGFLFVKGLPTLIASPRLLVGQFEFGSEEITILPALVTTLMAVFLSLAIAVPVGILTAVYLNEYAGQGLLVRLIRGAIDILSGVPSIVYGLFGMLTFVRIFGGSSSILAGSLTVSMMLLPGIVRSTEESLKSVPDSLREAALGLGAGKLRTVCTVVLPSALPGILSAVILSMGRVISESAPFLYTMGSVISALPEGFGDSGASLAVALYQLSGEGWYLDEAYATAVVLVILVLGLNLMAEGIASRLSRRKNNPRPKKKDRSKEEPADLPAPSRG